MVSRIDQPLDEQRCRKIFWDSYLLDRFSSSTLGRPFAIDDAVIDVDLPTDAVQSGVSPHTLQTEKADTTIFNHLIRLGQITSAIHYAIHQRPTFPGTPAGTVGVHVSFTTHNLFQTGETFAMLRKFHKRLQIWRQNAPRVEDPQCLYETLEYFELSYQEARLWLTRAVINRLPTGAGSPNPPPVLLKSCLQAAQNIISLFDMLRRSKLVTFSRVYTRLIFVSSLVIIFVAKPRIHHASQPSEDVNSDLDVGGWLEDLDDDMDSTFPAPHELRRTLRTASDILSWFSGQMPDMTPYAQLFEVLRNDLERSEQLGADSLVSSSDVGFNTTIQQTNQTSAVSNDFAVPQPFASDFQANQAQLSNDMTSVDAVQVSELDMNDPFSAADPTTSALLGEMALNEISFGENSGDQMANFSCWPFSNVPWMEGIDSGISGYIWDTITPWHGSPSASMDSHT